ncbi:hypothetical protein Tco_0826617 [Tanacetum coccineum]
MLDRRKSECGIRLILAPKSARAFFTTSGLIGHGSVKLPESPICGKLLWITAKHSLLSLTEEAAFSSFSLSEIRVLRGDVGLVLVSLEEDASSS